MAKASMNNQLSLLGIVANAYVTWFVGSVFSAAVGFLVGVIAAGFEGAYAGVVCSIAIVSSAWAFGGHVRARMLGGLFIGTAATATGLILGHPAGVAGGACSGIVPALLGVGDFDFCGARGSRALRAVMWVAVGALAGAAGLFLVDNFPLGD